MDQEVVGVPGPTGVTSSESSSPGAGQPASLPPGGPRDDSDTQPVPVVRADEPPAAEPPAAEVPAAEPSAEVPGRPAAEMPGRRVTEVYGDPAGQSVVMSSQIPPPDPGVRPGPGPGPGPRRQWPWRRWNRGNTFMGGAVALVVVVAVLVLVAAAYASGGATGPGGTTRTVSVTEGPVSAVDLQGVPGQVSIVAETGGQVRLTGRLHWTGHAPAATARVGRGHVLWLSYRCAAASPCTEDYRLVVPRRTDVVLDQPSGHVIISGLAGSLRISAASVDVSAAGLDCPALTAVITSGHMSAAFDTAPRNLSVTLTSAQATVRLPASASYAVSSHVTSGYVHVGVPQASTAGRSVTALIDSGELELLPS